MAPIFTKSVKIQGKVVGIVRRFWDPYFRPIFSLAIFHIGWR
jgi:hypothetical protein